MRKNSLFVGALLMAAAPCAAHADWTRSWVVEWAEPANYFDAPNTPDGTPAGVTDPGTDCPTGVNAANPEIGGGPDWVQVLVRSGQYTKEEAEWIRSPDNPERNPNNGNPKMGLRGAGRASVYQNPESTPDPGLTPVSGRIAEGFDLDGNPETGFTSPTGQRGIDNEFYRTVGCWKTYRGQPRLSSGAMQFNGTMRNGTYTIVIVAHGQGDDPMNDPNVRVGYYMARDPMVKDAMDNVAHDYTFRIRPDPRLEALFDARTVNGVIESTNRPDVTIREPSYHNTLELLRAQTRLEMRPDGTLKGHLGGYRPWEPVYRGWVNARGQVIEVLTWVELPAVWYAFKRNADYSPTGPGGERTHISYALRIDAVPAHVVTPDAAQDVASVVSYKDQASPAPARAGAPAPQRPTAQAPASAQVAQAGQ